jgi:hypothetical protein
MLAKVLEFKVEGGRGSQTRTSDGIVGFASSPRRLLVTLEVMMPEPGTAIDDGLRKALANNESVELRAVKNIESSQPVARIAPPSNKEFKDHW